MKISEIIDRTSHYFGNDRQALRDLLSTYEFTGKEYLRWKNLLNSFSEKPFDVSYGIFDDVADHLTNRDFASIDWYWLGDLSWEIRFVLNPGIERVYDFDKKLTSHCGGTARIAQFYVSEIVPSFVVNIYYMTYDKARNYWEFGPLEPTGEEKDFVDRMKSFLRNMGFTYLSKSTSLKQFPELYSDCKEGNASLFDVLFTDTHNYQLEIQRFNDRDLKDHAGRTVAWNEYYAASHKLRLREEFTYYPSGNVVCVVSDRSAKITEVKVWRDIGKLKHQKFHLNIRKEYTTDLVKRKMER